jgi:hypothetical protein
MPENQPTWTSYRDNLKNRALKSYKYIDNNMGLFPAKSVIYIALAPYYYENLKTDANGGPSAYVSAKVGTQTNTRKNLQEIPLYKAISPLKILNPFKAVEAACLFVQFGLSMLVDNIAGQKLQEAHPVAKAIKWLLYPFALVNIIISPLSTIEKIPPLQKFADFLGIKGPLEKENRQQEQVTTQIFTPPSEPSVAEVAPKVDTSASSSLSQAEQEKISPVPEEPSSSEALIFQELHVTHDKKEQEAKPQETIAHESKKTRGNVSGIIKQFEEQLKLDSEKQKQQPSLAELKQRRVHAFKIKNDDDESDGDGKHHAL